MKKILIYSGTTILLFITLVIFVILYVIAMFLELIALPFRKKEKENSNHYLYDYYD